jgi:hypothetical protein
MIDGHSLSMLTARQMVETFSTHPHSTIMAIQEIRAAEPGSREAGTKRSTSRRL